MSTHAARIHVSYACPIAAGACDLPFCPDSKSSVGNKAKPAKTDSRPRCFGLAKRIDGLALFRPTRAQRQAFESDVQNARALADKFAQSKGVPNASIAAGKPKSREEFINAIV